MSLTPYWFFCSRIWVKMLPAIIAMLVCGWLLLPNLVGIEDVEVSRTGFPFPYLLDDKVSLKYLVLDFSFVFFVTFGVHRFFKEIGVYVGKIGYNEKTLKDFLSPPEGDQATEDKKEETVAKKPGS